MSTTEKKWHEALAALYATRLDVQEIKVWQDYLRKESLISAELIPAIEEAAEHGRKPLEWKVTVRDLLQWVRIHRAKKMRNAPRTDLPGWAINFIAESKAAIDSGESTEAEIEQQCMQLPARSTKTINEISWQILGRRLW